MYVYLLDKRSMGLLSALSLMAALLLFSGGVLLGLYFDLPPTTGPAQAFRQADSGQSANAGTPASSSQSAASNQPAASGQSAPSSQPAATVDATDSSGSSASSAGAASPQSQSGSAKSPASSSSGEGASSVDGVSEETADDSAAFASPASPPALGETGPPSAQPSVSNRGAPLEPAPVPAPAPIPAPAPAPGSVPTLAARPPAGGQPVAVRAAYALQVGAYSIEDNARREVSSLQAAGYEPYVVTVTNSSGRALHTVRLGAYENRREAVSAAGRFATHQGRKAWVRPIGR